MPLYTFYPCKRDGLSGTFSAAELPNEDAAQRRAQALLDAHASCTHVEVWSEEALILTRRRESADAA